MASVNETVKKLSATIRNKPSSNKKNVLFYVLSTPLSIFDFPDLGLGFQFIDTANHLIAQEPDGFVYSNSQPIEVSINDDDTLDFSISMKCNAAGSPTLKCGADLMVFMPNASNKFELLKSINGCAATVCILGTDMNNVDIPIAF
ncbi:hypothetical protein [Spirosoma endbachense]|uniref:Uncharacterized protein n=1 Tax=Spirosoma endbachense TaxID=2666025 RepID=A0A6P1W1K4_9BACT|nr:hypothetical protein [Spirosoma endbachense]QHV97860.1 hypothetical protein GJR95_23900 [Spirosoma endbachense]